MPTPLMELIDRIRRIESRDEERRSIDVLEKVGAFPSKFAQELLALRVLQSRLLSDLGWDDVSRWVFSRIPSLDSALADLARTAAPLQEPESGATAASLLVTSWNNRLRDILVLRQTGDLGSRRVLCAFSSVVDATFALQDSGLENLLQHAARFARLSRARLLGRAYEEYQANKATDRGRLKTVVEVVAQLMFAYEHPGANNKPVLEGEAEKWGLKFCAERRHHKKQKLSLSGGGASCNIGDVLGGLGLNSTAFWSYHPQALARCPLPCSGSPARLKRISLEGDKNWREDDFNVPGGAGDHPMRLSLVLPFTPTAPSIEGGLPGAIIPGGQSRLILQFNGYRPENSFWNGDAAGGAPPPWYNPAFFASWSRIPQDSAEKTLTATGPQTSRLADGLHQAILSGFKRSADRKDMEILSTQLSGFPVHHEISDIFDGRGKVDSCVSQLKRLYAKAARRTAGMNDGELAEFTSWVGTDVFVAPLPTQRESFLQMALRAAKVREVLHLDWIYVHGNDIDLAVTRPGRVAGANKAKKALRDAILYAKVVVFAAIHLRSGVEFRGNAIPSRFEPSCSPKGFLGLFQFAREFAGQYGVTAKHRASLQGQILSDGFVSDPTAGAETGTLVPMPEVVAVPVYWPDPEPGVFVTGAGDITSSVVAVLST